MSTDILHSPNTLDVDQSVWRLDPARSSVEFHVRHFYGLMTVIGRFARYEGTLDLRAQPAVQLTIDADSLDTNQKKRDQHLRSPDFFDVEHHPQVRFVADAAVLEGERLRVNGQLHAAGKAIPLEVDAALRQVDGELELEAVAHADHRALGMTWSPLGILRAPSKLIVRGRAVREGSSRGLGNAGESANPLGEVRGVDH
jgi:polyisoprenoid-binding protein YceI